MKVVAKLLLRQLFNLAAQPRLFLFLRLQSFLGMLFVETLDQYCVIFVLLLLLYCLRNNLNDIFIVQPMVQTASLRRMFSAGPPHQSVIEISQHLR